MKAWEVAFYRTLYAMRRPMFYCGSLIVGTVLIVILNLQLIPPYGIQGAIVAAIVSIAVVDLICAGGLVRQLAVTVAVVAVAHKATGAGPWTTALAACGLFPPLGVLLGLVPHPRHSPLLREPHPVNS